MPSPNKPADFQVSTDSTHVHIHHPDLESLHIPLEQVQSKNLAQIERVVLKTALQSGLILSNAETQALAKSVLNALTEG